MADGFVDPNAGRYRGDDAAASRTFREIQKQLQHMREDPIYRIEATTAIVGTYKATQMAGRTSVDGASAAAAHWGMGLSPANQSVLLVNTLESPTNSASAIDLGTVLVGSRRMNANGTDTVFVSYSVNSARSKLDHPDPDPNGPGPSGPIGGIPPDPDPATTACPLTKTVTIAGTGGFGNDGTCILTWNAVQARWFASPGYLSSGDIFQLKAITSSVWELFINKTSTSPRIPGNARYRLASSATCPPDGDYPIFSEFQWGPASTCTIS